MAAKRSKSSESDNKSRKSVLSSRKQFAKDELGRMGSSEETGRSAHAEAKAQEKLRHMGDRSQASRSRHPAKQSEGKRSVLENRDSLTHEQAKDKMRHMGDKR